MFVRPQRDYRDCLSNGSSVPTVKMCEVLMLGDCSLGARPAQGAATTVDIRCLSSLAKVSFLACKTGGFGVPEWPFCYAEGRFCKETKKVGMSGTAYPYSFT